MIHTRVSRDSENKIFEIHISVTSDSLDNFTKLIYRSLNTWDTAPAELKDLGDMLTHGYITQDHKFKPINSSQRGDYYTPQEQAVIKDFIIANGFELWLSKIKDGTSHEVLKSNFDVAQKKT